MTISDETRVRERFKEVFGETRPSYLEDLLQGLPTRGLVNVLSDIEEVRTYRIKQSLPPGFRDENLTL
ncbi:MAG TPA: hypothetical protein VHD38_01470 [Candidatus Paceibacterota bacterium]|nr:hypothetical protein [Candidatus Paceibacterota bacterium]